MGREANDERYASSNHRRRPASTVTHKLSDSWTARLPVCHTTIDRYGTLQGTSQGNVKGIGNDGYRNSLGTVRLMFTRGPTRAQFLFAKLGATIVCIVIGVLVMFITGVLASQLLNLASGIGQDLNFFTASWLVHTILFVLVAMLNWLMYAAIAIFFGTLGRAIVAGIIRGLTLVLV